jgi:peptidoglycan-N-acetylglucosamine deacetylase
MMKYISKIGFYIILFGIAIFEINCQSSTFNWPKGKAMGLSFTWDDGRESQVLVGTPLLDKYGIKATFYVIPSAVEKQLLAWKKAVKSGHEIANHSLSHPCSGNFLWSRSNALEDYSLQKMEENLLEANAKIQQLLGIKMTEFAYPCGQTFVGKGENTQSYVPLIAKNFNSGRTWLDEAPNDATYCDLSQITGVEMDGKNFEDIINLIASAKKSKSWLVLAGHDIGQSGTQTTKTGMLEKLFKYLKSNADDIWVAPVGEISKYIKGQRADN